MGMSGEAYQENNIRNVPFTELFAEYREKFKHGQELQSQMNEAYLSNKIGEAFTLASVLGVVSIQLQILTREVERRDEEDGPLSTDEALEVEAMLFEGWLKSLFK